MGMPIVVDVRDDEVDEDVLERCSTGSASSMRPSAPTRRTARSAGSTAASSRSPTRIRTCARCSTAARSCAFETDGYFDVRAAAPDAIDPSGLVKGWAVDRAAAILDEAGVRNYAVNVAGDMRVRGRAVPEPCWSVGIQHPLERERRRRGRRGERSRRRDLGRVRARRPRPRPAHPPPAGGRPVGHDHRPGARDRRRLRDRGVRDGRGGRPLDRAAARATRR